jgi:hypothetical protein
LTFLFIFHHLSYSKNIIYFTMIYFINKENLNTTYNFTVIKKQLPQPFKNRVKYFLPICKI